MMNKNNAKLSKREPPLLVLFKGYPGTGKTYLAERLSEALEVPLVVRDKLKTVLRKHHIDYDQIGKRSYRIMWEMADKYLKDEGGCVCDTSLIQPDGIPDIETLKSKHSAQVVIIECYCSDKNIQNKRIKSRALFPSYYSVNSVEQLTDFESRNCIYDNFVFPYETIRVDTSKPINFHKLLQSVSVMKESI